MEVCVKIHTLVLGGGGGETQEPIDWGLVGPRTLPRRSSEESLLQVRNLESHDKASRHKRGEFSKTSLWEPQTSQDNFLLTLPGNESQFLGWPGNILLPLLPVTGIQALLWLT